MRSIAVKLALSYLRFFARVALFVHRPLVIGIAGSVGKTSAKHALEAILRDAGTTCVTSGNSETGLPLGILGIKLTGYGIAHWAFAFAQCPFRIFNLKGVRFLIAEMGIDAPETPKNMEYLLTIVEPDIAVIIAESPAHTMQFEHALTAEEKLLPEKDRVRRLVELITAEDAKMTATKRCKSIVYNGDSRVIESALGPVDLSIQRISFGRKPGVSLVLQSHEASLQGTQFDFASNSEPYTLVVNGYALPAEYGEVFGAALLAAREAGVQIRHAIGSLERNFRMPKGRATLFRGTGGSVIIDSTYNASPASVSAFLALAAELKKTTGRTIVFVFGDMRELGDEAAHTHREVTAMIPGVVDYLYCVGPLTKKYVLPVSERFGLRDVRWFKNARVLGEYLTKNMPQHALVIAKGSQNGIFLEEAVRLLLVDPNDAKKLCRQEKYWVK